MPFLMVPRNGLGACPRRPGLYYFTHLPSPAYSEGKLLRGHCLAWLTLQFLLKVLTANLHLTFSLLWPRVNVTGYVPCKLNRKPAWPTPALPGELKAEAVQGPCLRGTAGLSSSNGTFPPTFTGAGRRLLLFSSTYVHFYHLVIFSGNKHSFSINR